MGISRWLIAAATIGILSSPSSAAWLEAHTDHFVVYSEGGEASVREFATRLERFDRGMRLLRQMPDEPADRANPLIVYVVPDAETVQKLCRAGRAKAKGCLNVAGFYEGRADGSVAFTPRRSGEGGKWDLDAQAVLFHEYSHHFMAENSSAAYPAWFIEGFAEFNATASFERNGVLGFGRAPLYRAYGLLNGKPLTLLAMLTADNRELTLDQREALYGRGWLLTHYLTFEKSRKGQLSAYLDGLNAGKASIDAAKAAFGDLATLDHELDRYLDRPMLSYIRLPVATPIGPVTVRPLTPGEAAVMPAKMQSDRGVDDATAALVVVQARRLAAPFPSDVGAQDELAEAEFDAGNDDLAEAAADRALAVAPNDLTALLYKGRTRVRRAARAKVTDQAVWREARRWFVKANHLEPDAAEPLLLFYASFLNAGVKAPANAVTGLEQAFALAPQDETLRALLARQYLLDGRMKEARRVLAPLAFDPHAAPDNFAATLIVAIDQANKTAIEAELNKPLNILGL